MNKLLSAIMALAVALALLTGSIAVPVALRPFYYAHIVPLHISERSCLTAQEICQAYDEVLDYCTGEENEFSAGILSFSAEGAAHFADCRLLFLLDHWLFAVSMAVIAAILVYDRKHKLHRFHNRGPAFWGASGMCAVLLAAGAFAAVNFDRAFKLFHTVLFPGKTNWVLNYADDPVVKIFPEAFFFDCALLVVAVALFVTAIIVVLDLKNST